MLGVLDKGLAVIVRHDRESLVAERRDAQPRIGGECMTDIKLPGYFQCIERGPFPSVFPVGVTDCRRRKRRTARALSEKKAVLGGNSEISS